MSRNLKMPWSMKDTVENMERIRDIMIKKVRQMNLDGKAEEDVREVNFDFNRVKEALQKQIAIIVEVRGEDDDIYMYCPRCEQDIYDLHECGYDYCPYCGQELTWPVE